MDPPSRTRPFNFERTEDDAVSTGPTSYQHALPSSEVEVPYSAITSPNSDRNGTYHTKSQTSQDVIEETPRSLPLAPEEMGLIERPKLRKTYELDQDFEFGPACQINPGQFTKQLKNPGPLCQTIQPPILTSGPASNDRIPPQPAFPMQEPSQAQHIEERVNNHVVSAHTRSPPAILEQPRSVPLKELDTQGLERPPEQPIVTRHPPKGRPYGDVSPPSRHRSPKAAMPLPRPHINVLQAKASGKPASSRTPDAGHSHTIHRASGSVLNDSGLTQPHGNPATVVNGVNICGDNNKFPAPHRKGVVAMDVEYQLKERERSKDRDPHTSATISHTGEKSLAHMVHCQDIGMGGYSLPGGPTNGDVVNGEPRAPHSRSLNNPDTRLPKVTSPYFESRRQEEPSPPSGGKSHRSRNASEPHIAGSDKPSNRGAGKVHTSSKPRVVSPIRRRAVAPAARSHKQRSSRDTRIEHKQTPRPSLEGSNVSRRRAAPSTTARSEIIDIPSTPGSEMIRSSPDTNNKSVKISQEFTKDLAGVLNRFTTQHNSTRQELREKYHKYIKQLKKKVKDREHEVKEYLSQIDEQAIGIRELEDSNSNMATKIEELEHSKEELARKVSEMEAMLEVTTERGSKAENKYRKVKDHLNAAIEEQQKLYLMSKSQWEKAIKEVRESERNHEALLEEMLQRTEVIRQQMLEKVRLTVGQLYGQIGALTRQIQQKDVELSHEKEAVKILSQQLETLKITNEGLEGLRSQQKNILGKLDEQNEHSIHRQSKAEKAFGTRLDQITDQVGSVFKAVSEQPQILPVIQSQQQEILERITSKFEAVIVSTGATEKTATQISTDIKANIKKILTQLGNEKDRLSQQLNETVTENGRLAGCIAEKEEAFKTCREELQDLRKRFEDQQAQFSQLQAHAVELEVTRQDNQPLNQQLQFAQAEIQRLEGEISSRSATISQLEKSVRSKEEAYAFEVKNFGTQIQQLNQLIVDKEATHASATAKAAELVRRELLAEKQKEIAELNKKISQLRSDRKVLDDLVSQLRQEKASEEEAQRQHARIIESLKANLAICEEKCTSLAEELKTRSDDLAGSRHQTSARISTLEADLALWQKKAAEFEANYKGLQEVEKRHTSAIESLKVTLAAAESKCSSLSEELRTKSLELEKSNQQNSSRITDLGKELATWQEKAAKLQAAYSEAQKSETARKGKLQECLTSMEQLAVKEGLLGSDAETSKLFDADITLDDVWPMVSRAFELLMNMATTKYQTTMDKQRQQLEALKAITTNAGLATNEDSQASLVNACNNLGINPLQQTQEGDPEGVSNMTATPPNTEETSPPFLQHRVVTGIQDQERRVSVRRPTSTEGIRKVPLPPPPSVAQEKSRRREVVPPKSIMKRVTRSASREQLLEDSSGSGAFGRIGPLETFTANPPESIGAILELNTMSHEVTSTHFSDASVSGRASKRKRSDEIVDSPGPIRRGRYSRGVGGKRGTTAVSSTSASASVPGGSTQHGTGGMGQLQRVYRSGRVPDKATEGSRASDIGSAKAPSSLPQQPLNGANRFLPPRAPTRTYGSRKSVGPAEDTKAASQTDRESQSRSQSQPLSRYWGAHDETQDSITFSQNGSGDRGDLPPFPTGTKS
ncbi:hypothetical protein B0T20DRAFT_370031 [Sordaria brevicollis]|uniref:Uncharacterized protein n=1 Tax=Sordaria brevicollis TaxID=83679 RepID=A0AAE0UF81_SORBR|nr:hypothetical protein B0T20DRAFT_370031 [Sordaria brevicollis]